MKVHIENLNKERFGDLLTFHRHNDRILPVIKKSMAENKYVGISIRMSAEEVIGEDTLKGIPDYLGINFPDEIRYEYEGDLRKIIWENPHAFDITWLISSDEGEINKDILGKLLAYSETEYAVTKEVEISRLKKIAEMLKIDHNGIGVPFLIWVMEKYWNYIDEYRDDIVYIVNVVGQKKFLSVIEKLEIKSRDNFFIRSKSLAAAWSLIKIE